MEDLEESIKRAEANPNDDMSKTNLDYYGYTKEEHKMIDETKKILHDNSLNISVTCVRVPIFHCHSEVVSVDFAESVNVDEVIKIFSKYHFIFFI